MDFLSPTELVSIFSFHPEGLEAPVTHRVGKDLNLLQQVPVRT